MSLPDMSKLMQFKEHMENMQSKLSTITAEGSVGGGMVRVKVNGQMTVLSVAIEEDLFKKETRTVVEEMLCSAVNVAMTNVKENISKELGTQMPSMPDIFGMMK